MTFRTRYWKSQAVLIASHPHIHDLALFACGVAVLVMMLMSIGNMEVPQ